jgi:hypothetical protein
VDVDFERVVVKGSIVAPNVTPNLVRANDLPGVTCENRGQEELFARERQLVTTTGDEVIKVLHTQMPVVEDLILFPADRRGMIIVLLATQVFQVLSLSAESAENV